MCHQAISTSNIMNQIVDLAKLEKEVANKEVVEIEAKYQPALRRQRKANAMLILSG
jgi:hypothetical protein